MTLHKLFLGLALAAALLSSAGCGLCRNRCATSSASPCCAPPCCDTGCGPTTAYSVGPAGCCNGR